MEHRNQHFVTKAYLKAWCDPATPNGAFVWAVNKVTKKIIRTSPKKLFREEDFYTVIDEDGNRILELEHKLHKIEDEFIDVRDSVLIERLPLSPGNRKAIALFVATMLTRTKIQRDEQKQIWQDLIDYVNSFPDKYIEVLTQSPKFQQIVKLRDQPIPFQMFNLVNMIAPILLLKNCAILETNTNPGFITSDNPCSLIDQNIDPSAINSLLELFSSPTLKTLLPISPNLAIRLESKGPDGYLSIDSTPGYVNTFNLMTVGNSEEFVVVNQKTIKDIWFQQS